MKLTALKSWTVQNISVIAILFFLVGGPAGVSTVLSASIPPPKGSKYVLTLLEHDPVMQEKSLPKITIAYPEGKSEQFLKKADKYSALFSKKSYLTSVTSGAGLKPKVNNSDVLLLLSAAVDDEKYVESADQNSVLTIALGTSNVMRNNVSVSINRTEQDGMNIHVNWKRLEASKHELSYKMLNLAKVHRE